ncbi:MAG: phosphatase PAP2 family protein [Prevotella sp.]|nr:phosphatase PAP2 family protein [Prevotella sp.]
MAKNKALKLKDIFGLEKKPEKGLLAFEWIVVGYTLLTLLVIFFTYTKLPNAQAMIVGRVRIIAIIGALWFVYRLAPCPLTRFARVGTQLALLAWWYPDTYELNRILPNLDHIFAQADQNFFGFQPALLFSQWMPWPWFSELMDLGYASYFPMIAVVVLYYFFYRYRDFDTMAFVVLGSFFIFYVIFIFLPVTGPQYYYLAIGPDNVLNANFEAVGDYFYRHTERIASPGWQKGIFYHLVEDAHQAGERPTAAFPSSHIGITVVLLILAWRAQSRRQLLFWCLLPFAVLMFFATVYIQAHYVVDSVAGLFAGFLFYAILIYLSKFFKI